jgi:hypothetical protein
MCIIAPSIVAAVQRHETRGVVIVSQVWFSFERIGIERVVFQLVAQGSHGKSNL